MHRGYTSLSGLAFNIDGRVVSLPPTDLPTKLDGSGGIRSSSREFVMQRADFNSMLSAKLLRVRLDTMGSVLEGDLLRDAITGSAIEGFKSFGKRLP